jgi:hypothetical protein
MLCRGDRLTANVPFLSDRALLGSKFYACPDHPNNLSHALRNLSLYMAYAFDQSPIWED